MRWLSKILAGMSCVGLLAACAQQVDGTGVGAVRANAGSAVPTGFPSTGSPVPTTTPTGGTASSAGDWSARELPTLLAPAPAGGRDWGDSWSRDATPSVGRFVAHVYTAGARADERRLLRTQGLTTVAHRTWIAADRDQADEILLRFSSDAGAVARWVSATGAKRSAPSIRALLVPGETHTVAYYSTERDSLGNVAAIVYGYAHNVVMELFYFSPGHLRPADMIAWAKNQLARLR